MCSWIHTVLLCVFISVDGNWGQWTSWSQCSNTCGDGERSRTRKCDDPEAKYGGNPCPGPDPTEEIEVEPCFTGVLCPVDGLWCPWQAWNPCTSPGSCGYGVGNRVRDCNCPAPAGTGSQCATTNGGGAENGAACFNGPCCAAGCGMHTSLI